ncbi:MAG: MATE family efflux transporter [Thiolinea sp.]
MSRQYDLTQGDEKAHLIRLTIPMIWGIFAIMGMMLADTYFVAQLGTDPLAAMGFTFPVVMIISSLAFGVGTGTSSLVARAIGSQHQERVQTYTTQSIIISLLIALAFALLGYNTVDPVFRLLGAPEHLLPLIHDYIDVWYLGCFMVVVPMVGNSAIRAAGNTKLPSNIMIVISVVNVILDPIFIFGWFGFPRLELQGAALATLASYSVALIAALYVLKFKLKFLTLAACSRQILSSWKAILRLAIPAAGTNLINPVAVAITTWMIAGYGSEAVAGYSVASRIESFCLIVIMALSSILAPFAGQNQGAGKMDRLERALQLSFRFSWFWGLGIMLLMWLIAPWLIGIFTDNVQAAEIAKNYLYIVPVSFALMCIIMMVSSVANGIGEPVPALVMTLARLLIIYLPLAGLFSIWMGVNGIFLATAFANALVGGGAFIWSQRKCAM